jgi:hypothetical protein
MLHKSEHLWLTAGLWFASLTVSSHAFAVGNGIVFNADEGSVPGAVANMLQADSMDFTYHACSEISIGAGGQVTLRETGYFWVSSYQDATSVVDSQINHFVGPGNG